MPDAPAPAPDTAVPPDDPKAAFLAELKRTKKFFYGTVVAQAQQVEVDDRYVRFVFTEAQRTLARQIDTSRAWLEAMATRTMGRTMTVAVRKVAEPAPAQTASPAPETSAVSREVPPDMEPPLPTEPPPEFDPSPVHPVDSAAEPRPPARSKPVTGGPADDLLAQAMGDQAVQTLLEVFPSEIKDVEEL